MNNFYCQKTCGEDGFSIEEWNETYNELEKANLTDKQRQDILFPPHCNKQCFDCMANVGERRLKTKDNLKPPTV